MASYCTIASNSDDVTMKEFSQRVIALWDKIDPRRQQRPLVLAQGLDIRIEHGQLSDIEQCDKVAIVAGYSPNVNVSRSVSAYLNELSYAGFGVLYINVCSDSAPLNFSEPLADNIVVGRRPNRGYDFGTWAVVLAAYPLLARKKFVLLTNDSLAGPFTTIKPLLDRACYEGNADIVAMTSSTQIHPHIQSYFLLFRDGILADPELSLFFARVRIEDTKENVVAHNELQLQDTATRLGYSSDVLFQTESLAADGENPTLYSWRQLLDAGWPFVKKTIIADPSTAPRGNDVAHVVHGKFGIDIKEWI